MYDNTNNFESQVRDKLQDLDFTPSKSVWDNIDAQLPAEKKRRGGGYWLGALLLAAAAIGGIFFFNQTMDAYKPNNSTLPGSNGTQLQANVNERASSSVKDSGANVINASIGDNVPISNAAKNMVAITVNGSVRSIPVIKRNQFSDNKMMVTVEDDKLMADTEMLAATIAQPVYNNAFAINFPIKDIETPSVQKNNAKLKQKRWELEISAEGGQSIFNSGKMKNLFTAAQSSVLNNRETTPNAPPATPPATLWMPPLSPSDVKPGKSVSIGLNVSYRANNRVSFITGLHYSLLTTKIQTSDKVERAITLMQPGGTSRQVSPYYNVGYTSTYTNKYHFIELPLLVRLQLNEGRKVPLYTEVGLSVAQLINTNTLHYDGTANVYFQDKSLVQKTFLNTQAGISAKLFANKRFPLIVGPQIQYGLTNLFKGKVMVDHKDKHSLVLGFKLGVPIGL